MYIYIFIPKLYCRKPLLHLNPTSFPEPYLFKLISAYAPDKGQHRLCGFICLHLCLSAVQVVLTNHI